MTGKIDRFMADAFHQAAIAGEHVGMVIDDIVAKFGGQLLLGQRHADRGGNALPQRSGRHFDALGVTILGMARGPGAELAKVFDLLDRHILVAAQVEQAVEQHRAVPGGEDKAIAIGPVGGGGIELEIIGE